MPSQEGGSFKYRYFQQQIPSVFLPPFVAEMLAAVRMQEESNCPNRMAGWLFLPWNACCTLYRCTGSQDCPAFPCMAGITTMCSLKKPYKPYTSHPNSPQSRKASSSAAHFMYLQSSFRDCGQGAATHLPLSGAVCVAIGKVNPQRVEAKEMKLEGETVDSKSQKAPAYWNQTSLLLLFSSFPVNKNLPAWLYNCSLKRLWPISFPPVDSKDTVPFVFTCSFLLWTDQPFASPASPASRSST